MRFKTIFFDLDDTLYSKSNGLWNAIRERMSLYMHEKVGISWDIIPELRHHYFTTYGTTLRGLQKHHQVDADDYLAYVHDLQLDNYIEHDPKLIRLLDSMDMFRKFIFTNADSHHAARVLHKLGVEDYFEAIIDVRAIGFACKPETSAYLSAIELAGIKDPTATIYLDDSILNLRPATEMGMYTILVGDEVKTEYNAAFTATIHDLPRSCPEIWYE